MAIGSALSVGLIGLKAFIIQIQAFVSPGLPYFSIIGLPDTSLSEARERVKSACQASGAKWPETRVTAIFRRRPCPNADPHTIWRSQRACLAHPERYRMTA